MCLRLTCAQKTLVGAVCISGGGLHYKDQLPTGVRVEEVYLLKCNIKPFLRCLSVFAQLGSLFQLFKTW